MVWRKRAARQIKVKMKRVNKMKLNDQRLQYNGKLFSFSQFFFSREWLSCHATTMPLGQLRQWLSPSCTLAWQSYYHRHYYYCYYNYSFCLYFYVSLLHSFPMMMIIMMQFIYKWELDATLLHFFPNWLLCLSVGLIGATAVSVCEIYLLAHELLLCESVHISLDRETHSLFYFAIIPPFLSSLL